MRDEPGKQMARVLPHGFCHHQRRVGMNVLKNVHAHTLARDESMLAGGIVCVRATQGYSLSMKRARKHLFERGLRGPADFICTLAQIAVGYEQRFIGRDWRGSCDFRDCISRHWVPLVPAYQSSRAVFHASLRTRSRSPFTIDLYCSNASSQPWVAEG